MKASTRASGVFVNGIVTLNATRRTAMTPNANIMSALVTAAGSQGEMDVDLTPRSPRNHAPVKSTEKMIH